MWVSTRSPITPDSSQTSNQSISAGVDCFELNPPLFNVTNPGSFCTHSDHSLITSPLQLVSVQFPMESTAGYSQASPSFLSFTILDINSFRWDVGQSLGLDGFLMAFWQFNWDFVNDGVMDFQGVFRVRQRKCWQRGKVVGKVISKSHNAFVEGRQILDAVLMVIVMLVVSCNELLPIGRMENAGKLA
ncbi:hypothetical protein CK203_007071 [Vitis vinifera]|uniref:Uncharacterized protein n=1 Tax=Vitis vinifera TaxID=29760 RepID=A0A438KCC6_VITVI|nr:hypothetical protein CK203_007071 [Vitis vinifera]